MSQDQWEIERRNLSDTGEVSYGELSIVRDGFMKHVDDLEGLEVYLKDMGVLPKDAELKEGPGGHSKRIQSCFKQ